MNDAIRIISMILLIPLVIAVLFGFTNLVNILDGTHAHVNGGEEYCLELFRYRYNKTPYDVGINLYGDCIYKLDYMQEDYTPVYDLIDVG